MALYEASAPGLPSAPDALRPVELACLGLAMIYVGYLVGSLIGRSWLVDVNSYVIPTDFINVWAAGRLVLEGRPEAAYDWSVHRAASQQAIGYAFDGYYAWLYPPPFLFAAAPLAMIPLAAAQFVWPLLTFPAYVATIRTIVGHRMGGIMACAFPPLVANFVVGQNGFLSAALLGGTLGFMQRRPLLAGTCLGLLTYKPQFGILFPLALIAGRCWRVIAAATAVAIVLNAAAWAAFGTDSWIAFFHSLPVASKAFLTEGRADWSKLQSLYGVIRWMGGSDSLAWSLQLSLIVVLATVVCAMWRAGVSFAMKAAALATAALLASPYLYMYDLAMLAVPMAFLIRLMLASAPLHGEIGGLVIAVAVLFAFPFVQLPLGPLAALIVAALVARRTWTELGGRRQNALA